MSTNPHFRYLQRYPNGIVFGSVFILAVICFALADAPIFSIKESYLYLFRKKIIEKT